MTLPCEELALSLETSKLVGIDQEQGRRGMPTPDCPSTEGAICSIVATVCLFLSEVVMKRKRSSLPR